MQGVCSSSSKHRTWMHGSTAAGRGGGGRHQDRGYGSCSSSRLHAARAYPYRYACTHAPSAASFVARATGVFRSSLPCIVMCDPLLPITSLTSSALENSCMFNKQSDAILQALQVSTILLRAKGPPLITRMNDLARLGRGGGGLPMQEHSTCFDSFATPTKSGSSKFAS